MSNYEQTARRRDFDIRSSLFDILRFASLRTSTHVVNGTMKITG